MHTDPDVNEFQNVPPETNTNALGIISLSADSLELTVHLYLQSSLQSLHLQKIASREMPGSAYGTQVCHLANKTIS